MKKILTSVVATIALSTTAMTAFAQSALPPADAKAGECYAKVLIPAVYNSTPENVLVQPETIKTNKIPAVYKDVEKRVLIEEESYELVAVPPTYGDVTERVLVQPEQVVKSVVPATYKTESKQILISPARVEWKQGRGAFEKVDSATGEIMCRVEIPAKYETVSQTVLATPPQTKEDVIPAKYMTITRRVMKDPPSTQRKVIPAKYKTITVKELVTPEQITETVVPAKYESIAKRALVSPEAVDWRAILCETNTTPGVIKRVQTALVQAGYSIGTSPNGNYGPATRAAIQKYQVANGLPTGGLTISTIKKLGVAL